MNYQEHSSRCCIAGLLLFISIGICYSNTFHVTWQFDDFQNIRSNTNIQLSDFTFNQLQKVFYAAPQTARLNRPVSYLTFAMNWFFTGDKVAWYHIINILIHCFSALFLFMFLLAMMDSPNVSDSYSQEEKYFIALFSAFLWSVNPVQTQAVTYIVQRMASLAGMFYILSMLCYVRGRMTSQGIGKAIYWLLCGFSYLLAILSKSNAVTLPVALFLIEFLFFQNITDNAVKKKAIIVITGSVIAIGGIGFFYFFGNNLNGLLHGYQIRPYTLSQRLMTEFRIIIFYLSQIFYPVPTRLSLVHVYPISTSLIAPYTTILCFLAIVSACFFSVYAASRAPFLSFSILFYFLNHLVESTIIPLELVYEHRNYIPSMFLFVPVSIGLLRALNYYDVHNQIMRRYIISTSTVLLILLGTSTHVRNMAWQTQKSLWEDVLAKAPGSSRPYHNLAWGYYEPHGAYDQAISYYKKSAAIPHINLPNAAQPYLCIGLIYDQKKDIDTALKYYRKAIRICPGYVRARYRIARDLTIKGHFIEAENLIDSLLHYNDVSYIWLKGILCMNQKRLDQAINVFRKIIKLKPNSWEEYFYIGVILNLKQNYDRGNWFLRRADAIMPHHAMIKLSLVQNFLMSGKKSKAAKYAGEFFDIVGPNAIQKFFDNLDQNGYHIPFGYEKLKPFLSNELTKRGKRIIDDAQNLEIHADLTNNSLN